MSVIYKNGKYYGGEAFPQVGDDGQVLTRDSSVAGGVKWATPGIDVTPEMRGANYFQDGEKGLVPKPYKSDVNKFLCGNGKWEAIYSSTDGSTVVIATERTDLIGLECTLTDDRTTMVSDITPNAADPTKGEAVFQNVQMSGRCTAVVDVPVAGAGTEEWHASVDLSYFGMYQAQFSNEYATIRFTSRDFSLIGKTVEIYFNNTKLAEVVLSPFGEYLVAYCDVDTIGDYTCKVRESSKGLCQTIIHVDHLDDVYEKEMEFYHLYAWRINENNSDPSTCVEYCDTEYGNECIGFSRVWMDFDNDTFRWGDWTGNEFFFPKPCLLGFDGVVICYLDPNDYSQDVDGNPVDIHNTTVQGNVMVEWPTIYFKRYQSNGYTYCLISDKQPFGDTDFKCYAHHDINGDVLPYIYLSAFFPMLDSDNCSRSLYNYRLNPRSGGTGDGTYLDTNTTRQGSLDHARNNNLKVPGGVPGEGWSCLHKADRDMVNDLLILIGRTTNTQANFGYGCEVGTDAYMYYGTETGCGFSGSMMKKGMFWGTRDNRFCQKVFHMENWWAFLCRVCLGDVYLWNTANSKGYRYVKLTYGKEDGSNCIGFDYNVDYTTAYVGIPVANTAGECKENANWSYDEKGLIVVYKNKGTNANQYLCDLTWYYPRDISNVCAAVCGGYCSGSSWPNQSGAFTVFLNVARTDTTREYGGSTLTFKGLA